MTDLNWAIERTEPSEGIIYNKVSPVGIVLHFSLDDGCDSTAIEQLRLIHMVVDALNKEDVK